MTAAIHISNVFLFITSLPCVRKRGNAERCIAPFSVYLFCRHYVTPPQYKLSLATGLRSKKYDKIFHLAVSVLFIFMQIKKHSLLFQTVLIVSIPSYYNLLKNLYFQHYNCYLTELFMENVLYYFRQVNIL